MSITAKQVAKNVYRVVVCGAIYPSVIAKNIERAKEKALAKFEGED